MASGKEHEQKARELWEKHEAAFRKPEMRREWEKIEEDERKTFRVVAAFPTG